VEVAEEGIGDACVEIAAGGEGWCVVVLDGDGVEASVSFEALSADVCGDALGVEGSGHDDQLGDAELQGQGEEEVGVEVSLVELVDDEGVPARER
jgi:hypothetical protein